MVDNQQTGTTLNVNLSSTLQTFLGSQYTLGHPNGVFADIVYFSQEDASGTHPTFVQIVNNGNVLNHGSISVPLTAISNGTLSNFTAGKIYFVVAPEPIASANAITADPIQSLIKSQADLNPAKATGSQPFRYDSFEVTLKGLPSDAGNLTDINSFGFPMSVIVTDGSTQISSGGYNVSGSDVFSKIGTLTSTANSALSKWPTGLAISGYYLGQTPAQSPTLFPSSYWNNYLGQIASESTGDSNEIVGNLRGVSNGIMDAANIFHNGSMFDYTIQADTWTDAKNISHTNFVLSPTAQSVTRGTIVISQDDLANSIYATNGNYKVFDGIYNFANHQVESHGIAVSAYHPNIYQSTPPVPNAFYDTFMKDGAENTGFNNQWATIFTQFITGLNAGYFLSSGKQSNPALSGSTIDLSDASNWNLNYAFGGHTVSHPTGNYTNPYEQYFYNKTNSYGSGYSDSLLSQATEGSPLLSMSNAAGTGNAPNIALNIYADTEAPSAMTGYVAPDTPLSYIAPTATVPTTNAKGQIVLAFNMQANVPTGSAGQLQILPNQGIMDVTLNVMNKDGTVSGSVDLSQKDSGNLWHSWNLVNNGGTWDITTNGGNTPGQFSLYTPAVTGGQDSYWLKMTITNEDTGTAKDYNIYYSDPSTGSTSTVRAAIDTAAAATFVPGQVAQVNIGFLASNISAIDPALLIPVQTNTFGQIPTAPTVGTIGQKDVNTGNVFQTQDPNHQTKISDSTIAASTSTKLLFGWSGLNQNSQLFDPNGWASQYTNKVLPKDFVEVDVYAGASATGAPKYIVFAQADLDGIWQTGQDIASNSFKTLFPTASPGTPLVLPAGAYTVNFHEFQIDSSGHQVYIGDASHSVHINVTGIGALDHGALLS